ncbi:MAG: hypothetical protein M1838_002140 [Thelocarpon superellum]|nr:MAG: hypothetical protein M1838_002140 [Thelocarpon superellum]
MLFKRNKDQESDQYDDSVYLKEAPVVQNVDGDDYGVAPVRTSRHPRNWSRRKWIIFLLITVLLIVGIIVGVVVGVKMNKYPNYYKVNYGLVDSYSGPSFFNNFDYFTGADPTQGFVNYLDAAGSEQYNLTSVTQTTAILKVDTSQAAATTGRMSARIESKMQWNEGLFIFDVLHTPNGCGTWPALWLTDPSNWPYNGEIDVAEGVNGATTGNQITLHTSDGCSMGVKRKETGSVMNTNCYNSTNNNAGCAVQGPSYTFGQAFNDNGGGVYATELRSAGIRSWFFQRSSIPTDILMGTPDPSSWGTAMADFPNTDCNIGSHFQNQSIIANIDLCGSWAGDPNVYSTQDGCPGTCTDYVANNPSAFTDAYWEFGTFNIYQAADGSNP